MSGATVDCAAVEFELSPDQEALRDAARLVLERHAPMERVRQLVGPGEPGPETDATAAVDDFDRQLWAVMVDQGWPAIEEPPTSGGLGLGMVELTVLCEEIGRAVAPTPFLGHCLALDALRQAAHSARCHLGTARRGHSLGRPAGRGRGGGLPGLRPDCRGRRPMRQVEAPVSLTCRPEPTLYASVADLAVVVTPDALWALELSGERPVAQPAMDRTRALAWLRLDGAPAIRIGDRDAANRVLDRAATAMAAELLGAADRVLAMSVDYACERVQFGHPIGSFQAVKHRLADALVDVEGMRSTVFYAAWCLATGQADASLAASSAKAWCSDAARRVMATGLQVHGGIGFTWEHDLHLFMKRAQLDAVSFGDADFHRDRLATLLAGRPVDAPALF